MGLSILLVVVLVVAYVAYTRSQELFHVVIRDGKASVVRGHVPGGLLGDFATAVRHVKQGEIGAHKSAGGARLSYGGDVDADTGQRLRNIFSLYPMARLRAPNIDKRQALSDIFLVSWLISLVRGFFR